MSRILRANGVLSYRLAIKTVISPSNIKKKVEWCQKHKHPTLDKWKTVVFTDESSVCKVLGRKFYRKRVSDPPAFSVVKKLGSYPLKVMFWGCISGELVGRLVEVSETLT